MREFLVKFLLKMGRNITVHGTISIRYHKNCNCLVSLLFAKNQVNEIGIWWIILPVHLNSNFECSFI